MQTTRAANRLAARGHTAAVVRNLKRLGMQRCSEALVRRQWDEGALQPSWYCLFWRWFLALWYAHRAGAESLFEDFCARVAALRGAESDGACDWYEQLALCAREQSEALQAAIRRRDPAAVRRELLESIAAEQKLVAMLGRPQHHRAARRAA